MALRVIGERIVCPTMIHTFNPCATDSGGINSWIRDFVMFSTGEYLILGVGKQEGRTQMRPGVAFESVSNIPSRRRFFPDVLRLIGGVIRNFAKLTDRLIVHRLELAPIVRILRPRAEVTLVIHTNMKKQLESGSDSLWRYFRPLYFPFEALALRSSNSVISHCIADYPRLAALKPEVTLVPGWFNESIYFPTGVKKDWDFIWVGRLESVKDPLLALSAFADYSKSEPAKLLIVGAGSLKSKLEREIRLLGLESSVTLLEPVPQSELAKLFSRSSVLLQTSHFEGSSRVLLEGMACGLKVVSLAEADPDGWVTSTNSGQHATSRNPADVASAMKKVQKDDYGNVSKKIESRAASQVVPLIEELFPG